MSGHVLSVVLLVCSATSAETVVVCPTDFRPALVDWMAHRQAQGHDIAVVSNLGTARDVRSRIREEAQDGRLRFIVLIGDGDTPSTDEPDDPALRVAVHRAAAKVNVRWGSEPHIATDNWYADLDGDALPDAAIGRITADTPQQLRTVLAKVLDYEQASDAGLWRRRINFVAGLGGFGRLADAALEMTARRLISTGIPAGYATSMTYASWQSPYCPDPREFCDTTVSRLNEGCLFWVYMGHGMPWALDRVMVPDGHYHIFGHQDVARLDHQRRAPIALLLACYTGAFDASHDCLAERMLAAPGGPVAVIAGSRVTMPYAMSVLGTEMMDECFVHRRDTLGEVLLHAKRNLVKSPRDDPRSKALDVLAAAVDPAGDDRNEERAEHVLLFNLLGDPLLRLRHPGQIELSLPAEVRSGDVLEIAAVSPLAGQCTVELTVNRDRLKFRAPARREYDGDDRTLAEYTEVYQQANDPRLAHLREPIIAGPFQVRLQVPDDAWGPCQLRVFVEGQSAFAIGAAPVRVVR